MRFAVLAVFALTACGQTKPPVGGEEGRTVLFKQQVESPRNSSPERVSMQELVSMTGGRCAEAIKSVYRGNRSGRYYYALQCNGQELLIGVSNDAPPEVLTCAAAGAAGKPCDKPWQAEPTPGG